MKSDDHKILVEARELILDPENWTQGSYHNDDCLCALGAGAFAAGTTTSRFELSSACARLERAACTLLDIDQRNAGTGFYVVTVNDGIRTVQDLTPHQAVIKMFDMAIAEAAQS